MDDLSWLNHEPTDDIEGRVSMYILLPTFWMIYFSTRKRIATHYSTLTRYDDPILAF